MEIPGLVPSNPRRNTSQKNSESYKSGDKADTCFHFVSALYPLPVGISQIVEIKRKHVSTFKPPIINKQLRLQ